MFELKLVSDLVCFMGLNYIDYSLYVLETILKCFEL